jgi:hypothetical protein
MDNSLKYCCKYAADEGEGIEKEVRKAINKRDNGKWVSSVLIPLTKKRVPSETLP